MIQQKTFHVNHGLELLDSMLSLCSTVCIHLVSINFAIIIHTYAYQQVVVANVYICAASFFRSFSPAIRCCVPLDVDFFPILY